jgi:hypothetical protein
MFAGIQDEHNGIITSGGRRDDKGETAEEPTDGEVYCKTCFK